MITRTMQFESASISYLIHDMTDWFVSPSSLTEWIISSYPSTRNCGCYDLNLCSKISSGSVFYRWESEIRNGRWRTFHTTCAPEYLESVSLGPWLWRSVVFWFRLVATWYHCSTAEDCARSIRHCPYYVMINLIWENSFLITIRDIIWLFYIDNIIQRWPKSKWGSVFVDDFWIKSRSTL